MIDSFNSPQRLVHRLRLYLRAFLEGLRIDVFEKAVYKIRLLKRIKMRGLKSIK
jgi:hypothetical protein